MSQSTAISLTEQAKSIDLISGRAVEAFATAESFEKELGVALAVSELREALTPEIMKPVMALMNTPLGFKTDRDPKQNDKDGKPHVPYSIEVVRECFIEARLRGFHMIGNEVNIIAGNFYATKNGLDRKVRNHPKVSDFKDTYDVPRLSGDKGALVKCRAEWKQEGKAQVLEREFAVRVNSGMGSDGIIGKAQRKLMAAVYSLLTGVVTPEGETGDEPIVVSSASTPAETDLAAAFPGAKKNDTKTPPPVVAATAQQELADIVIGAGYKFDTFLTWAKSEGQLTPSKLENLTSFDDLSEPDARRLIKAKAGLLNALKTIPQK